jgi:hypothetical protein
MGTHHESLGHKVADHPWFELCGCCYVGWQYHQAANVGGCDAVDFDLRRRFAQETVAQVDAHVSRTFCRRFPTLVARFEARTSACLLQLQA